MRILVTGATGFVGGALVPRLLERGHECAALVRAGSSLSPGIEAKARVINVSPEGYIDTQQIKDCDPQIVIHLAAFITSGDTRDDIEKLVEASVLFPTRLCDALQGSKVELFINTGTFAEYYESPNVLNPAYLYAAMKSAFRPILKYYACKNGFSLAHVIPFSIYGEGAPEKIVINQFVRSATSGEPIDSTEGRQVLDFIHISDVVEFYVRLVDGASKAGCDQAVYHLGTGVGTSLRQLAALVGEAVGKDPEIRWGARPYRPLDVMHAVAPAQEERDALGWKPKIDLKEGLRRLLVNSEA